MIREIRARFSCDDCGAEFTVDLDPGYDPPEDWTVMDVAEDAIRGGTTYRDGTKERYGAGSVQDDRHLCAACTKKRDSKED